MTAALEFAPSSEPFTPPLRKAYAHVRFPSGLLRAWVRLRLTKTEIVTDAVVRALADRRRIELSSTCIARRAGSDPSDVRRSLRKLEQHHLVARAGNRHDPNGCVLTPASAESLEDSSHLGVSIGVLLDVVLEWSSWSRVEILVHVAVCGAQEARRRGLPASPRVTARWLSSELGVPERSCRWALRRLEARGVLRRHQPHRWVEVPWSERGLGVKPASSPPSSRQNDPRLRSVPTPEPRQRVPRARPAGTHYSCARDLPTDPSSPQPGSAAVCPFHSQGVLSVARRLLGAGLSARRISSALRRLDHLGANEDEMVRFLRYQFEHRDVRGAHFPLAVVSSPDEFLVWRSRKRARSGPSGGSVLLPRSKPPLGEGFEMAYRFARSSHQQAVHRTTEEGTRP